MASRLCCVVVLLACAAVSVSASRQLLQSTSCPVGCSSGGCIFDSSANSYKCVQCQGSLVVNAVTGTCDVPPGRYADWTTVTATNCPKGSFCPGGVYVGLANPNYTDCTSFTDGLTTIGQRATSKKACVNMPGYSYAVDGSGNPSAAACLADTYGPGLRKQRACTPCPPGYTTNTATQSTNATACGVPAGYFLKAPGQVAPCPMGEYKAEWGVSTSCTKCASGVTTNDTAQVVDTACNVLVAGFYAKTIESNGTISLTAKCPQKYYCPGGQPSAVFDPSNPTAGDALTIIQCADGAWTQGLGSTSISQCMTPPGFKTTVGVGTTECDFASGYYRAEWTTPSAATTCDWCGSGILAEQVDQITVYGITDEAQTSQNVAGSAGACYIKAGMGMYYSAAEGKFRAVPCNSSNYGVADTTYGLSANPCRDCPANMKTDKDVLPSQTYWSAVGLGFTNPLACVTKPGYGYNGRSSYQCRAGTYNAGNNYAACTACGEGLTTETTASQQASVADCIIALGYGNHSNLIQPCPVGYFNNETRADLTTPCIACPTGLTTSGTGSNAADQCNICQAGYGNNSCATQCGGTNGANYGVAGADASTATCVTCPTMTAGFAFDFNGTAQDYAPAPIARLGASVASDCLAGFAQILDVAWYLPTSLSLTPTSEGDFAACTAACDDTCLFVTYDYNAAAGSRCTKYTTGAFATGTNTVAFKAVSYADTAAQKLNKAKAIASGSYTFWKGLTGAEFTQAVDVGAIKTVAECLAVCDADVNCAAVVIGSNSPADLDTTQYACATIAGDTTLNTWKRSVTHAVPSLLSLS